MTYGDDLIGVPTDYKGVHMRSKLESKVAYFLDQLKILWIYEPKPFLLSNGFMYVPDFYLPDLKIWIEVKGVIKEHNEDFSKTFVKDNKTELLVISAVDMYWVSAKDFIDGIGTDRGVYLGNCSRCKKYFFCSELGSYHCRACNYHEGDHDLVGKFRQGTNWKDIPIDFSDINSIKGWLNVNKSSL